MKIIPKSLKHIIRTVERMKKNGTLPDLNVEIVKTLFGNINVLQYPILNLPDNQRDEFIKEWRMMSEKGIIVYKPKYSPIKSKYMNLGQAIEALKQGKKVARQGWNGKGMFLYLINGSCNNFSGIELEDEKPLVRCKGVPMDMELLPWVGMKTADDKFVPWLASQTDMLSEDWCEVHEIILNEDTPPLPEFINMCERGEKLKEELGN